MNSEKGSDTQALSEVRSSGELHRSHLLQSLGYCALELTHTFVKKAAYLPFPFGAFIGVVGDTMSPWLYPLVSALEGHSLCLLAFFDDQLYAMGGVVKGYLPVSSGTLVRVQRLQEVMEQALFALPDVMNERGFVGICSDLWVSCKVAIRECAQEKNILSSKLPMLNFVVPIAGALSDWLVEHNELEESEEIEKQHGGAMQSAQIQDKSLLPDVVNENTSRADEYPVIAAAENTDVNWSDSKKKGENLFLEFIKMAEEENNGDSDAEEEKSIDPLIELLDSSWLMGAVSSKKHP